VLNILDDLPAKKGIRNSFFNTHSMYKIVTVTFNPCVDKSTSVPALVPEKKLRCTNPNFEPGGGGINVARAVKKLGGDALAIYPAGGYSGKFLNELLLREHITTCSVETKNHTRENLIVLDLCSNVQYRFGMPGPILLEIEWQQCLKIVEEQDAEYIVVSGSLPAGVPPDIIARIARIAKRDGRKLIVDTTGLPLKYALEEGVYMIKPNLGELGILQNMEVTIETAAMLAKEIVAKGQSKIVVVSLGAEGALLITENLSIRFMPPQVKKLSTVGAGDSMVAGIVYALSKRWSVTKAVQYGVACGTAATMNPGTELCHLHDVEGLFSSMQYTVSISNQSSY
jgi:6-phosphofructokinase 2